MSFSDQRGNLESYSDRSIDLRFSNLRREPIQE
jgi:hypothetical protein